MRRALPWLIGLHLTTCLAAGPPPIHHLEDLYFGEALYYAYQGDFFEALNRLDAELGQHYALDDPKLDSLYLNIKDAEFSVGDFELRYRMHLRAGRTVAAVLGADVDEAVRNDAIYRLAKMQFQNGQPGDALHSLDGVSGKIPSRIRDDVEFLRANTYMALRRPADAVKVLRRLQGADGLNGFSAYNLGIALLQAGKRDQALRQLAKAGQVKGDSPATSAIRDKSNLVLGTLLMDAGDFVDAKQYLDRVRLTGPFSNQALLRSGWAAVSAKAYDRAIVPWSILAKREVTNGAVQEAMLDLPYAYGNLHVYGRAAVLYGHALDAFVGEIDKLDASIKSIREGKFLKALVRPQIKKDKDWVIRLRSLPQAPETYYLMNLMASNEFQSGLQNYLDLEDLRRKLVSWQNDFDAYEDIIRLRRQYYEPRLPEIDQRFRELDSRMRLRMEQHKALDQRLQSLLIAPQPGFLATAEEQAEDERIDQIEHRLVGIASPNKQAFEKRIRRLKGVLVWNLRTHYDERLTAFDKHLRELDKAVKVLTAQYHTFVRLRQAATHSYEGYDTAITRLRTRVHDALGRVQLLMARQGHLLEVVAIDQLEARRKRLVKYANQARYALADSYDRATKEQSRSRGQD